MPVEVKSRKVKAGTRWYWRVRDDEGEILTSDPAEWLTKEEAEEELEAVGWEIGEYFEWFTEEPEEPEEPPVAVLGIAVNTSVRGSATVKPVWNGRTPEAWFFGRGGTDTGGNTEPWMLGGPVPGNLPDATGTLNKLWTDGRETPVYVWVGDGTKPGDKAMAMVRWEPEEIPNPNPNPPPPPVHTGTEISIYTGPLAQSSWLIKQDQWYGKPIRTWQEYVASDSWDNGTFPSWQRGPWQAALNPRNGRLNLHVNLIPGARYENAAQLFREIDQGLHDEKIRQLGRRITAMGWNVGKRMIITVGWEWNGNWFLQNVGMAGSYDLFARVVRRWIKLVKEGLGPVHDVEFGTTVVIHGNLWIGNTKVQAVDVMRLIGNAANGGVDYFFFNLYNRKWQDTIRGLRMFDYAMGGSDGIQAYINLAAELGVKLGTTETGIWPIMQPEGGSGDDLEFWTLFWDRVVPKLSLLTLFDVVGPEGESSKVGPDSPYPQVQALFRSRISALLAAT